ncbi:hypothetical protein [Rhabdothermincola sp.]|mgnify:CR=1 FL=1|uniref:hypothetical protein n=1 Tax=Rhabdothermincola sp. TaxID=2820405 RepID=UPI002FDF5A2C
MARRIVVLALALVLATGAVAHAQYVPGQPGFQLDPATLPDTGGSTTISGVGCPPNVPVEGFILVGGQEIFIGSGMVKNDKDGPFQFVAQIPPLPAGEYTVIVKCGGVIMSNLLTITSTTPITLRPQPGPLPRTGADVLGFVKIGLGLVVVGGLLLLAERKRRRAEIT